MRLVAADLDGARSCEVRVSIGSSWVESWCETVRCEWSGDCEPSARGLQQSPWKRIGVRRRPARSRPPDPRAFLPRVDALRSKLRVSPLTDARLPTARAQGRRLTR